jgi:limonene-1,2-epoxide hydrolase
MRRRSGTLVVAAAVLVAGCGGGGDTSTGAGDAEATVREYLTALVEKDGARACAKLTPQYQRSVVQQNQAIASQRNAETCPKLLDAITRSARSVAFEGQVLDDTSKVGKVGLRVTVRASGDQKSATVTGARGIQRYELETRGGGWLIAKIERTG